MLVEKAWPDPSYKFRQNSDFWYLTGFAEPNSAVILGELNCGLCLGLYWDNTSEKNSSSKGYSMTLLCSGKDSVKEKWEGPKCIPKYSVPLLRELMNLAGPR